MERDLMEEQVGEWRSRGYLPHFDKREVPQFITFRLADSLPQEVLERWRVELEKNEISDAVFRRRIELYLDQNYGSCHLRDERIAEIVRENLEKFDRLKYKLHAWVIMPNHVHLLLTPFQKLEIIVHSCKSYTASAANKTLNARGKFWFPEYFDRFIRNRKHFENTLTYIENNPVKAALCEQAQGWRYSSAYLQSNQKL